MALSFTTAQLIGAVLESFLAGLLCLLFVAATWVSLIHFHEQHPDTRPSAVRKHGSWYFVRAYFSRPLHLGAVCLVIGALIVSIAPRHDSLT